MRLVLLPQHSHHLAPEHACPDPDGVILGLLGSIGIHWDPLGLVDGGGLVAWWLGGLNLRHMTPDLNMKKVARIASKI